MTEPVEIIDVADTLSRKFQDLAKGTGITFRSNLSHKFQELAKGTGITLRCNDDDFAFAADEAFAVDKLFPMFLDMAMMLPPTDPDLRVVQCTNPDYMFAIQSVVPSLPHSGIEEKWESRLRTLITSFKEQAGASAGLVDMTEVGLDYAICSSWNDVPTFDDVESALNHYRSQVIGNVR